MPVALTLPPGLSPGVVAEEPAEPPFPPAPEPPKSEPATPCPPPSEGLSSAVPEHARSGLAARTFRNVRRLLLTRVPFSCLGTGLAAQIGYPQPEATRRVRLD